MQNDFEEHLQVLFGERVLDDCEVELRVQLQQMRQSPRLHELLTPFIIYIVGKVKKGELVWGGRCSSKEGISSQKDRKLTATCLEKDR
jgi:hypothetical protein